VIYTQEDWKLQNANSGYYIIAQDGNEGHVAIAQVFPRGTAGCETKGNALLMKAAPKMYEALKKVADIEQTAGKVCSLCGGYLDHKEGCLFVLAEQALAEVEGKEGEDGTDKAS